MRKIKDNVQKIDGWSVTVAAIDGPTDRKVLFQHKIDRLTMLLKGTKLDPATMQPKD